jgi:hypothetical protein
VRDLGREAFMRFMDSLHEKIHALVNSSEVHRDEWHYSSR